MNTCGMCKFFGKLVQGSLDDFDAATWEEEANTRYHVCDLLKHMNGESRVVKGVPAGVIDGSGYRATFCVSEEFGCNQWESAPPTLPEETKDE